MRSYSVLTALLFAGAFPAQAATIDFSSTAAMQSTCADARGKKPAQLRRDDDKVAYVICSGVDLIMDTGRWAKQRFSDQRLEDTKVRQDIRAKVEEILGKFKTARVLLESVHASKPLFAIQPGEWVSIYGTNLASGTVAWTGNFPTSLGGTSVTINGRAAYLSFVSPTQISLQAPSDNATGSVPVIVTTASGSSTSAVTLAQVGPSFTVVGATATLTGVNAVANGSIGLLLNLSVGWSF